MARVRLAAFLVLASALPAAAADADARWYLKLDNDVAFGTDRWYTSGVRLARVKDDVELALEQDIYTPDAKNWHPGKDDRAPTARLLASGALHDRGAGYFQTIELALGVRGPAALGRQSTDAVHHVITAPIVDWSRQLDNRFDAQLAFARTQALPIEWLKVHGGATLGNQIAFAHAGFEVRAGDRTLSSALLRFAPTPPFASGAKGWSAYAGASARAVGRDELISRNYDPFGADLKYRRGIARIAAGVAWSAPWGSLTLDLAQDGREFDAQTSPQRFGSAAIHVAF
jgi:lipid A 3-O-deacylase